MDQATRKLLTSFGDKYPDAGGAGEFEELIGSSVYLLCIDIAKKHGTEPQYAGYGEEYYNDVFSAHPYCECESEGCVYCENDAPYFLHHKSGLAVWWYKSVGRALVVLNSPEDAAKIHRIFLQCHESLVSS